MVALYTTKEFYVKSKMLFSLFVLLIFVIGALFGGSITLSSIYAPSVGQVWAGAKEMQGAILLIDDDKPDKAKELLCNSIRSRLVIMEMTEPFLNKGLKEQASELEHLTNSIKRAPKEFGGVCI